jgi:hypothetical protein
MNDETKELLKSIYHALNMIPNKKNVGKNGESSYELASKLSEVIKENEKV